MWGLTVNFIWFDVEGQVVLQLDHNDASLWGKSDIFGADKFCPVELQWQHRGVSDWLLHCLWYCRQWTSAHAGHVWESPVMPFWMNSPLTPFFCVAKVSATEVALSSHTVPVDLWVIMSVPWQSVMSCRQNGVLLALSECSSSWHKKKKTMHVTLAMARMSLEAWACCQMVLTTATGMGFTHLGGASLLVCHQSCQLSWKSIFPWLSIQIIGAPSICMPGPHFARHQKLSQIAWVYGWLRGIHHRLFSWRLVGMVQNRCRCRGDPQTAWHRTPTSIPNVLLEAVDCLATMLDQASFCANMRSVQNACWVAGRTTTRALTVDNEHWSVWEAVHLTPQSI